MQFHTPEPRNDEERILPLVNIVFLLLIFFMLAGRLAVSDAFRIEPTRSASEGRPDAQSMTVLVGADGRLALDGEELDETALGSAVTQRMAGRTPGGDALRVHLKADGRVPATRIVAVMELLREAGIERFKLITVPARK